MEKINRTVVRNQAYRKSEINIRERHNERKNDNYYNADIVLERSQHNVHFKSCDGTYYEAFDKMLKAGQISTRGLKDYAKLFDEFVFDVNTEYFEKHGGYEFAKQFYEEAYRLAIKETGGEDYILSAVIHADERNTALSEELGKDVFHYHLHVVYIPVVEKEVRWSKRCKDPNMVGTVKETINQVSHSKKWSRYKQYDENGKTVLINSYSLLQDRFYEHMKQAGFIGFERGERGSTAEHLTDLDYKIKQDNEKLSDLNNNIAQKEKRAKTLDDKIAVSKQTSHTFREVEDMAQKSLIGNKVSLTNDDWETILNFAKDGIKSKQTITDLSSKIKKLRLSEKELSQRYEKLRVDTANYIKVKNKFPLVVDNFIHDLKNKMSLHSQLQIKREQSNKHEAVRHDKKFSL